MTPADVRATVLAELTMFLDESAGARGLVISTEERHRIIREMSAMIDRIDLAKVARGAPSLEAVQKVVQQAIAEALS